MSKYEVNFDEVYFPSWVGGGLCTSFEAGVEQKAAEYAEFIGPIALDGNSSQPLDVALKNIATWYHDLPEERRRMLNKDLKGNNPFKDVLKSAIRARKAQFYKVAKFVCEQCPVLEECQSFGLSDAAPKQGVYGGLDADERAQKRSQQRRRNIA